MSCLDGNRVRDGDEKKFQGELTKGDLSHGRVDL